MAALGALLQSRRSARGQGGVKLPSGRLLGALLQGGKHKNNLSLSLSRRSARGQGGVKLPSGRLAPSFKAECPRPRRSKTALRLPEKKSGRRYKISPKAKVGNCAYSKFISLV